MQQLTYSRPHVRDYGTLLDLTTHIDVAFVGVFSNVVMAAMSSPFTGGIVDDPSHHAGAPGGALGVVQEYVSGGSGGSGGAGGSGGSGGGGSGGGGGGGAGAKDGGGGKLPFTGFPVVLMAAVGALFASVGTAIRVKLRRREPG